jgi:PKHD-type hydroxylase
MLMCVANVMTADEVNAVFAQLNEAKFVDGKLTAGWHARLVKQNMQIEEDGSEKVLALKQQIHQAIDRNPLFQMVARPKAIGTIILSRYDSGMSYGTHVDNALMGEGDRWIRSDLSMTLFLSDPTTYSGGELVIENPHGEQIFKLPAGSMLIYPSSTFHRVQPVTQGTRLAAVTWVQSLVRDLSHREILFDLDTARKAIFQTSGKTKEFDLISKSYANLLRQWIEL